MHGQNRSQPLPCIALAIHGSPVGALAHTKPPSHGARSATCGKPSYTMRSTAVPPAASGLASGIVMRPSGFFQSVTFAPSTSTDAIL